MLALFPTRRRVFLSLTAATLLLAAGCDTKPVEPAKTEAGGSAAPAKPSTMTIAVIPKGLTHVFWQAVHAGADKAGAELGATIKWDGPQKESDTAGQAGVVENALTSKVDGIALAPLDKAALVPTIKKVGVAKTPLVIFDSAADVPESEYVSFVATDNKKGGEMAALRMGEITGGKGKVAVILNQANSASTMDREAGFEETIKAKFPGMTVIKSNFGNSDRAQSLKVSEDVLAANPDLVGVFGSCEPCAIGALQAVKNKGLVGKVKVVGFDNTKQMEDAMKAGEMDSLVIQNPFKMGYESVKAIVESKAGKKVEKRIDTGVVIMTKENMDKDEMKDFRAK